METTEGEATMAWFRWMNQLAATLFGPTEDPPAVKTAPPPRPDNDTLDETGLLDFVQDETPTGTVRVDEQEMARRASIEADSTPSMEARAIQP